MNFSQLNHAFEQLFVNHFSIISHTKGGSIVLKMPKIVVIYI